MANILEPVVDILLQGQPGRAYGSDKESWTVEDALWHLGKLHYKPVTVRWIQRAVNQQLVICRKCGWWERRDNLCEGDLCEVCYGDLD